MSNDYRELLIGCGHSREKRIHLPCREPGSYTAEYEQKHFMNLTTLDNNPECKPDVLCDLGIIHKIKNEDVDFNAVFRGVSGYHLPYQHSALDGLGVFNSSYFDEIHAYEVLEHCGAQGDSKLFFAQFGEFWRMLKPNGYFCATVPAHTSPWAWGDPGHTRIINRGTLVFLDKDEYERQLGKTSMSDYRTELGDTNFKCVFAETVQETFRFVLRTVK